MGFCGTFAGAAVVAVVGGAAVVGRAKLILFSNASLSALLCLRNFSVAKTKKFF